MSGGMVDLPELSVGPSVGGIDGSVGNTTLPMMSAPTTPTGPMTDQQALINTARQIGVDPVDLATVIHYESGFRPNAVNPDGIHTGLIQFGRPEQRDYGINKNQSFQDQLPGVAAFLQDRGYKPGMGFLDLYSTINAGSPGKYNAVDGSTNVSQKVASMATNRAAAAKWLGQDAGSTTAGFGDPSGASMGATARQGGFGLLGIQAQGGPVPGVASAAPEVADLSSQPLTTMSAPSATMMLGGAGSATRIGAGGAAQGSAAQPSPYSGVANALQGALGGQQQGQGQGQGQKAPGMQQGGAGRPSPISIQQARKMFDASRFYQMLRGQR